MTSPEAPQGDPGVGLFAINLGAKKMFGATTDASGKFVLKVESGSYILDVAVFLYPDRQGGYCDFFYVGEPKPLAGGPANPSLIVTGDIIGLNLILPAGAAHVVDGRWVCKL